MAMSAHDGLARSIRPAHTLLDGDTLFALATGVETQAPDLMLLTVMAAQATAMATVKAVLLAQSVQANTGLLRACSDLASQ
jgi:L-aminopeptidase/D-esterase-like protein